MDMSSVSDRCRLNRCLRCEEHKRRASKTRPAESRGRNSSPSLGFLPEDFLGEVTRTRGGVSSPSFGRRASRLRLPGCPGKQPLSARNSGPWAHAVAEICTLQPAQVDYAVGRADTYSFPRQGVSRKSGRRNVLLANPVTPVQKLGEETLPLALASSPGIFSGKTREPGDEDSSPTFSTRLLGYSTMSVTELKGAAQ